MLRSVSHFFLEFAMVFIFLFVSESSAVMMALCTEELTLASDLVVLGNVEEVTSMWSADGETIISRASILITQWVRGQTLQGRVLVEYAGGELGDIGLKVSDVSPLKKGENVLLFLSSEKTEDLSEVFKIVGKAQGKYTIDAYGVARKGGFSLMGGNEHIDNNIPIDELIRKIRATTTVEQRQDD